MLLAFPPRLATFCTDAAFEGAGTMLGREVVVGECITRAGAREEKGMWGRASATPWGSAHYALIGPRCQCAIASDRVRADMALVTLLRTFVTSARCLGMEIEAAA